MFFQTSCHPSPVLPHPKISPEMREMSQHHTILAWDHPQHPGARVMAETPEGTEQTSLVETELTDLATNCTQEIKHRKSKRSLKFGWQ